MSRPVPQNPVYPVDANAWDACLPKGACGRCGTIIAVRGARAGMVVACPACGARHTLVRRGEGWSLQAEVAAAG